MTEPTEGQRYSNSVGALVRVDMVKNNEVYFVAFRAGENTGCPKRMAVALFLDCLRDEEMRLCGD